MNPKANYNVFYEILAGVDLSATLPYKIANKQHKNVIVHLNNSQEKIFSSFYEGLDPGQVKPLSEDIDSLG
jgi:hypothetical protein